MAATFHFCEDNGAQAGSPLHGATRSGFGADTNYPTDCNWKNIDDNTVNAGTLYSNSPITAGNNSFKKYQYCHFSGSFNQILNCLWSAHTAGTSPMGTGLTLIGTVSSTYATPSVTTLSGTDFSSTVAIGSGLGVSFKTTGPEGASPSATLGAEGYSQYFVTQLQTTSGAGAGDTPVITQSVRYDEN